MQQNIKNNRSCVRFDSVVTSYVHRRTGHFWRGGLDRFCPKNMGQRQKNELQTWLNRTRQESLTTSIVENRWRTHIYIYIVLSSSIFVKHALNSHFVKYILPEKLLDCRKKNYFARLWGAAAPQLMRLWLCYGQWVVGHVSDKEKLMFACMVSCESAGVLCVFGYLC